MRTVAFAIALLMGGAAVAQTTTTTQPYVDVGTKTTTHTAHGTTTPTSHGTVHTTTHGRTMAASGYVAAPSNADPERDARGIPVLSDPAVIPAGWNGTTGMAVGGPLVDVSTGETVTGPAGYPACTATVTDNCVQAYERGRRR